VISVHHRAQSAKSRDEAAHEDHTPAGGEVCVLLRGEDAEDVVVLVDGFAVVAALLLVPPVAVGVAELALDGQGGSEGGVGVVAVLSSLSVYRSFPHVMPMPMRHCSFQVWHTMFGSSLPPLKSSDACSASSALLWSTAGRLMFWAYDRWARAKTRGEGVGRTECTRGASRRALRRAAMVGVGGTPPIVSGQGEATVGVESGGRPPIRGQWRMMLSRSSSMAWRAPGLALRGKARPYGVKPRWRYSQSQTAKERP
jgi:hypothetical protein